MTDCARVYVCVRTRVCLRMIVCYKRLSVQCIYVCMHTCVCVHEPACACARLCVCFTRETSLRVENVTRAKLPLQPSCYDGRFAATPVESNLRCRFHNSSVNMPPLTPRRHKRGDLQSIALRQVRRCLSPELVCEEKRRFP